MWRVNLKKDEYNKLQKELSDYHEKELANIKQGITDVKELLEGESFQLDQTTRNLLQLLGTIETGIIPLIDDTFKNTEQSVDTVITSFNNIDTIC